jgi:tRNA pseudouridine38-40 synthase
MQDRKQGDKTGQSLTKRNIRLTIAFEGSAYHGWQIQQSAPTVQGFISQAIAKITGEKVSVIGSGRTDSGTHARGLVANFLTASRLAPTQMVRALNAMLPRDIRILSARRATYEFHARRDAVAKTYRYQIYLGPILPPHLAREYFHYPYPIDTGLMSKAARMFSGEHDFTSFAKTREDCPSAVRHIYRCELRRIGRRLLFTVEGSGFLHHMVRNMVGTLLEVGRGNISMDRFRDLFVERDRRRAGFTAPAHGLILLKVRYSPLPALEMHSRTYS